MPNSPALAMGLEAAGRARGAPGAQSELGAPPVDASSQGGRRPTWRSRGSKARYGPSAACPGHSTSVLGAGNVGGAGRFRSPRQFLAKRSQLCFHISESLFDFRASDLPHPMLRPRKGASKAKGAPAGERLVRGADPGRATIGSSLSRIWYRAILQIMGNRGKFPGSGSGNELFPGRHSRKCLIRT